MFSGAINNLTGEPQAGSTVAVYSSDKRFIAYGLYNPQSQIRIRLYSWEIEQVLSESFWRLRLEQAIRYRKVLGWEYSNHVSDCAYRMVFSEADGLSGLTVDRYGDSLCVQFTSLAMYVLKDMWIKLLVEYCHPLNIILRTEQDMLREEGIEAQDGLIYGTAQKDRQIITEHDLRYYVNLNSGQKTGFYLDQRANRQMIRQFAKGRSVLDVCCYTGSFALNALQAGASSVVAVDVSATALSSAHENATLSGLTGLTTIKADAFKYLDQLTQTNQRFGMIILDPPKLTHAKSSIPQALKGYLHLNQKAMELLDEDGILVTCSCSGRISKVDFVETIKQAAYNLGKTLRIISITGADADHPVSIYIPETEYLKCVVCHVR